MKHRILISALGLAATLAITGAAATFVASPFAVAQDTAPAVAAPAAAPDAAAPAADAAATEAAAADAAPPVDPLVEKGKYLALIGNCVSCHTRHGGEPYAGGLPMKTPYVFLGDIHSTNITPDPETGIGAWTEAEFIQAMHKGVSPRGTHLLPAFPYTAFTLVSEDDLKAIYAFLKSLPPVKYTPPSNSLVFLPWRYVGGVWNALFFKEERFKPDPAQTEEWNRGAYLVNGLGHCGACHTPRNFALAEIPSRKFEGGALPDLVAEGKYREWAGVNLTQAKSGLGNWPVGEIQKYLKTGHSMKGGIFGPMNEVIINSLQHLTTEDAKAMAVYLKSLPAANESPTQTLTEEQKAAGAALYKTHCDECHLASGRGGFMKAPPIAGSAIAQAQNPASLINIILYGAQVGKGGPAPLGAWEDMKAFAEKMTNEEIATLANYVRSSWDNKGGPVKASDVAKQR